MRAKLVELIETEELRGSGKEGDVYRRAWQWWSKAGDLVAEKDEWRTEQDATERMQIQREIDALHKVLDDQLGKEREGVGLQARVLAAALGCKKWLEHEARNKGQELKSKAEETAPGFCAKPFCWNTRQCYGNGNYSKLCRVHNAANAKRQRAARERSKRRPKK